MNIDYTNEELDFQQEVRSWFQENLPAVLVRHQVEVALAVAQVEEGSQIARRAQDHVPSPSAISAAGSPLGSKPLPSEGHGAVSPVAGFDCQTGFVDEVHGDFWITASQAVV